MSEDEIWECEGCEKQFENKEEADKHEKECVIAILYLIDNNDLQAKKEGLSRLLSLVPKLNSEDTIACTKAIESLRKNEDDSSIRASMDLVLTKLWQNKKGNEFDEYDSVWPGIIAVFIIILMVFAYFSFIGPSKAEVIYQGCWAGAFNDGNSIISIDGCGDMVFDCESFLSCSINAQKEEDNDALLCVEIGRNKACTTAGYGIASV